jgi:transposase InsO family protein
VPWARSRYQRLTADEKQEALRLVERSPLTITRTLRKLQVPRRTYYRWQSQGSLEDTKPVPKRVKLLSDNGSGFIAKPFNTYLQALGIHHIFAQRNHPQTNGKIERLNRTAKEKLTLVLHMSPDELQEALDGFRHWYNHEHYHEAIGNLHPADVYEGRAEVILEQRKRLQTRTKKARERANRKTTQNPRKISNLQTPTTP